MLDPAQDRRPSVTKDADMAITPMLLLLIVTGQDKPKPDTPEDRARRAAIVDGVMAQPMILRPRIEAPAAADDLAEEARRQAVEDAARARAQALAQARIRVLDRQGQTTRMLSIEVAAPAAPDGEIDAPEPIMPARFNLNDAVLERENFDRWIFGEGIDEQGRRTKLQSILREKIDRVMKDRDIHGAQLQKLRLAGSGDIKRFFDRVEERRPEFEVARKNFNAGRMVLRELEPLSMEFQNGPFGDDSFFAKTLKKIDDDSKGRREQGSKIPR
jgi:hypothetical protein